MTQADPRAGPGAMGGGAISKDVALRERCVGEAIWTGTVSEPVGTSTTLKILESGARRSGQTALKAVRGRAFLAV